MASERQLNASHNLLELSTYTSVYEGNVYKISHDENLTVLITGRLIDPQPGPRGQRSRTVFDAIVIDKENEKIPYRVGGKKTRDLALHAIATAMGFDDWVLSRTPLYLRKQAC